MSKSSSDTQNAAIQPFYIWPKGTDLTELKAAADELNLPFQIKPFWFKPGKHQRAIALADGFPYIVDHVYPKTHAARVKALKWALGLEELPQAKTVLDKLTKIFGEGVTEVEPDFTPPPQKEEDTSWYLI